jgi:RimJ/RimL family protein N-acetyltransferase
MNTISRGISILKDRYRSLSILELIALLWNALFKNERILVYCISLQKSDTVDGSASSPFAIVKGELADLERARKKLERIPWELKCDIYDGVKDFFIFRDTQNGAIGHISWLYYKNDANRTLRLGDKECEIMFCLTLPEFRGKGLYPSALQGIQRYLKGRGYEKCFICATDDNLASIRGIEKSGFRLVGRTRLRKIFGFQISPRCDTRHLKEP